MEISIFYKKAVEVKGFKRYRGKDACNILGYRIPRTGISNNVIIDNKRQLKELNHKRNMITIIQ